MRWRYLALLFLVPYALVSCRSTAPTAPVAEQDLTPLGAAFLTDGISGVGLMRIVVGEYYLTHGEMPSSNQAAGLAPPAEFAARSMISATIEAGGVLVLKFDQRSGVAGGLLRLTPQYQDASQRMIWNCTTPSYPGITRWMPLCEFVRETTRRPRGRRNG